MRSGPEDLPDRKRYSFQGFGCDTRSQPQSVHLGVGKTCLQQPRAAQWPMNGGTGNHEEEQQADGTAFASVRARWQVRHPLRPEVRSLRFACALLGRLGLPARAQACIHSSPFSQAGARAVLSAEAEELWGAWHCLGCNTDMLATPACNTLGICFNRSEGCGGGQRWLRLHVHLTLPITLTLPWR